MKFLFALLVIVAISKSSDGRPSTSTVPCNEAADIVFLVDTSSSIWPGYFNKNVKAFLKDIIISFNIGPGPLDTRVGLTLFSTVEYLEFHLNEYQNADDLVQAVEDMRFRGGDTYTHRALEFAIEDMFTAEHGSREGVHKLMVILTDGKSANSEKTKAAANAIKAEGVSVFAIGVGEAVDFEELHAMASSPSQKFVYQVTDFRALDSIKLSFAQSTCEVLTTTTSTTTSTTTTTTPTTTTTTTTPSTTTTTTTTTTTPSTTTTTTKATTHKPITTTSDELPQGDGTFDEGCRGKPADIYFLLDSSSSIWIGHFHDRVLPFVRDLVSSFHISPLHTRVGLVTFSNDVNHEFDLSDYKDIKSLLAAIQPEHVDYLTGGTNTGDAIEYVTNEGFGGEEARKGVAQIIITVTDGLSQEPKLTARAAAEARRRGVYMFAVGVGKYVDEQELADISSDPDEDFVFSVDDFQALSSITELLALRTCKAVSNDRPSNQLECAKIPSNVMFMYEYLNSASASKMILDDLISQFTVSAAAVAPHVRIGMMTQPCVGGTTSMTSVNEFQEAMYEIRTNFFVGYPEMLRKLRMDIFSSIPETERRVVVMVLDEMTKNLDALQEEVLKLKLQDIKVIVVAVGKLDEAVLETLASRPTVDHVLRFNSYFELRNSKLNALSIVCGWNSRESIFGTYALSRSEHGSAGSSNGLSVDVHSKKDGKQDGTDSKKYQTFNVVVGNEASDDNQGLDGQDLTKGDEVTSDDATGSKLTIDVHQGSSKKDQDEVMTEFESALTIAGSEGHAHEVNEEHSEGSEKDVSWTDKKDQDDAMTEFGNTLTITGSEGHEVVDEEGSDKDASWTNKKDRDEVITEFGSKLTITGSDGHHHEVTEEPSEAGDNEASWDGSIFVDDEDEARVSSRGDTPLDEKNELLHLYVRPN